MKNVLIIVLFFSVSLSVFGQTGQRQPHYYFTGDLSVGKGGTGSFADSSSFLQIGPNGNSTKGVIFPHGNISDVINYNSIPGLYFHNTSDSSLYSISGINKVKQLNSSDTFNLVATKHDLISKQDGISQIVPITLPHSMNTRSDASAVVYRKGEYLIFFNYFYGASGDLGGASIAMAKTKNFLTFSDTTIIANTSWFGGKTIACPHTYTDPRNGTLRLFFLANKELIVSDTAKIAVYKMELPYDADVVTGWSDTVKIIDNNRREITASDRLIDVNQTMYGLSTGYLVMPFCYVVTGTGNSSGTLAYGGVYKSYDYGVTWTTGALTIIDGNVVGKGSVFEPGMYYIKDRGWWYWWRSLSGEVRRVSMGYDTTFNNATRPLTMMPGQNAMSTFKYLPSQQMLIGGVMRQLNRTSGKTRTFLDIVFSDDNDNLVYRNMVHTDSSTNELNEPTIFFADSLQSLIYLYTRTSNGVSYSGLQCLIIPYSLLQLMKPQIPATLPKLGISLNGTTTNEDNTLLSLYSGRISTDSAGLFVKSLSPNSASDGTAWATMLLSKSTSSTTNGINRYFNILGNQNAVSFESGSRAGKLFSFSSKADMDTRGPSGNEVFAIGNNYLRIPTKQDTTNTNVPSDNAIRANNDINKLEIRMAGQWYAPTENYLYELTGSNFTSDSIYRDTSLKNKLVTVFYNNVGKYLRRGAEYSMRDSGGIKILNKTVASTDTFIVRTEAKYIAGLVPKYLPLDSIGQPVIAVSFRKLWSGYTGYACRLTSLVDGSFIDVGFNPQSELDTIAINNWSGKDSCYISRWYNQGSSTAFSYFQSVTVPQGVRFRLIGGLPYAEYNKNPGVSYMNTNSNTSATLPFLYDGSKTVTANIVFATSGTTTSSVYGLFGNNAGSTATKGMYLIYDHRASASSINALSMTVTNGNSGQYVINDKYNNSSIPINSKGVATIIYNPSDAITLNRSKIYGNGSTAQQNNTGTNVPSSASAPTSFSLGTTGSNNTPLKGNIYEFIIYDTGLTDTQRTKLRDNQNSRYQIY